MESVSFSVLGIPMPKGSLTKMPNGAMIPAGSVVTRERIRTWREDVRYAAMHAMSPREPFKNAVRLMVDVSMPYPKSSVRKYQMGWLPHTKKPDIDKLLRSVSDHLTGIVWLDDAQVISAIVSKRYAWDGRSGAEITVDEYDEDSLRALARSQQALATIIRSGVFDE